MNFFPKKFMTKTNSDFFVDLEDAEDDEAKGGGCH